MAENEEGQSMDRTGERADRLARKIASLREEVMRLFDREPQPGSPMQKRIDELEKQIQRGERALARLRHPPPAAPGRRRSLRRAGPASGAPCRAAPARGPWSRGPCRARRARSAGRA